MAGLPYSWYANNWRPSNFDDAGNTNTQKFTEQEWARMSPSEQAQQVQMNTIGGGTDSDEYRAIQDRFRAQYGGDGNIALSDPQAGRVIDQGQNWRDPVTGASFTPHENLRDHQTWLNPVTGTLFVLGGAALGTALAAGGGSAAAGEGLGAMYGAGAGEGAIAGASAPSLLPSLAPSTIAGSEALMTAPYFGLPEAGAGFSLGGAGELASVGETGGTMLGGGAPVDAASFANTPWGNAQLGVHNMTAGNPGNFLDNFGSSVMNNPGRALRAGNSLLSMFGAGAGEEGDNGGGEGEQLQLGDSGWRPPTTNPNAEWMYGPNEEFSGWREQYDQSRMPLSRLRGMYG